MTCGTTSPMTTTLLILLALLWPARRPRGGEPARTGEPDQGPAGRHADARRSPRRRRGARQELYRFARKSFEKAGQPSKKGAAAEPVDPVASAELAALNVFVERAQIQLRKRVLWCGIGIGVCVLLDLVVAAVALDWLTAAPATVGSSWQDRDALGHPVGGAGGAQLSGSCISSPPSRGCCSGKPRRALEKLARAGVAGRLYVQMKVLGAPDPPATRSLTRDRAAAGVRLEPFRCRRRRRRIRAGTLHLSCCRRHAASSVRTLRGNRNGTGNPELPASP